MALRGISYFVFALLSKSRGASDKTLFPHAANITEALDINYNGALNNSVAVVVCPDFEFVVPACVRTSGANRNSLWLSPRIPKLRPSH